MARIMHLLTTDHFVRSLVPRMDHHEMEGHGSENNGRLLVKPLPRDLRNGQIGVSVLAAISVLATFSLVCYLTYRLLFWRLYQKQYLGQSQYIILIFNLLLADIVQSIGFLVCAYWAAKDEIRAHTVACHLQGMSLHIGDPASGLFILAIAVHTFALVISGKKLPHKWFVVAILSVWVFLLILLVIPFTRHGGHLFVPAGAWVSALFLLSLLVK